MSKELIVNSKSDSLDIALLEDRRLIEFHQQKSGDEFVVGDVYLGRIKKLVPGLNAAFVDVGHEKDGFLHYTDLGPKVKSLAKVTKSAVAGNSVTGGLNGLKLEPEIVKTGNVKDVLKKGQLLAVQVMKEPISTKGPRLTSEISIPGRYLVLVPFSDTVGVSRKIPSADERKRLKIIGESIRPKNFGIVIRTVATDKSVAQLHEDLTQLTDKWNEMCKNLKGANPGAKVLSEITRSASLLRDLLNDDFSKIVTNSRSVANSMEAFVESIAPEKRKIVQSYNGKSPLFDQFGVTRQIKSLFGKNVSFEAGAYLVIEHTEALHVIDVNSGIKSSMGSDQAATGLKVNLGAAKEIARQLRLRDMGGIIIIDFIDMRDPSHKKEVFNQMKEFMKEDRAKHTILPLSKFNLMQITRQRVRPEVNISTTEKCPTCLGTGKIESAISLIPSIKYNVDYLLESHKTITLVVHPFIEAYLRKGFVSILMKWTWQNKKKINLRSNNGFALVQYEFLNAEGKVIEL